jgi:hypothetical protein
MRYPEDEIFYAAGYAHKHCPEMEIKMAFLAQRLSISQDRAKLQKQRICPNRLALDQFFAGLRCLSWIQLIGPEIKHRFREVLERAVRKFREPVFLINFQTLSIPIKKRRISNYN